MELFLNDGFLVEDRVLKENAGSDGAVTVPGYVKEIGNYAFEERSGVTGVTNPVSVTVIESDAFFYCSVIFL